MTLSARIDTVGNTIIMNNFDMKDKSDKRVSPLGIRGSILFTIVNLIFIFGAVVTFSGYSDCLKVQKAIDGGVTAEAEIVSLHHRELSNGLYNIICRYVDENGIIYECTCGSGTYADYAQQKLDEQRIGEKVEIYIGEVLHGNKGACWAVSYGKDANARAPLAGGIVFVCLIFVSFALLTLYLLIFYDKIPFKKRSKKTKSKDKL